MSLRAKRGNLVTVTKVDSPTRSPRRYAPRDDKVDAYKSSNQVHMVRKVKRIELEPLPKATVVYIPETETLYLENGRVREDAEEMADGVLVYYDKHDEASAVALCIESADIVLKPFVDAILAKYGVTPEQPPVTSETSD